MKDQHTLITSYRDLSKEEINVINKIKQMANDVEKLIDNISDSSKEYIVDARWQAIAKTDLQKGFMALIRSVAKPESF